MKLVKIDQVCRFETQVNKVNLKLFNNVTWLIWSLVNVECADGGSEWLRGCLRVADCDWGSSRIRFGFWWRLFWGEFLGVGDSEREFIPPPVIAEKSFIIKQIDTFIWFLSLWHRFWLSVETFVRQKITYPDWPDKNRNKTW